MNTLAQLRSRLQRTWEHVVDGWSHLRERASHALTRFHHGQGPADEDSPRALSRGDIQWSLLAADVAEHDKEVVVKLEVPGMEADDFEIYTEDEVLIVRGEKRRQLERQQDGYFITECAYGRFERTVPLPAAVKQDRARAQYRRGVLTIRLPKQHAAKKHTIEVKSG